MKKKKNIQFTQSLQLKSEYEKLKLIREPYLQKAREAARYTIPSLLTSDDKVNQTPKKITTPNQSIGADGVNNLSAKTTLALLPPNQPFYKFSMDDTEIVKNANVSGTPAEQYKAAIDKGLALIEGMLIEYMEQKSDRVCLAESIKHILVAGNVLIIHTPKEGLKYYPLNRYVCQRDYQGNVLKVITVETIAYSALPDKLKEAAYEFLKKEEGLSEVEELNDLDKKELTLYTGFLRSKNNKHWLVKQELETIPIEDTEGKYPIDICPFMALRYTRIDGESYGRGLIEEYIGDISYLDTLSLAIKQTSLAASKLIMLVKQGGIAKIASLSQAENGDFVYGNPDDVTPLQANKYYDLQTARAEKESIEKRLNRVFLLAQAVQRDSERTTAYEVQYMVRDLEESLGNYYSILAQEFQPVYVKIAYFHFLKEHPKKNLPDIVRDKNIKLLVTTGLQALGRGADLNKWTLFFETLAPFMQYAQAVGAKTDIIAQKVADSLNLDITGVLYTEEEKQAMQQQTAQQETMNKIAPNAVNKYGDMMIQQQQQETEGNNQ